MIQTAFGLPSEGKSFTHEQNMANAEIPDLTFLSKGQLRRMIETLCKEKARAESNEKNYQEKYRELQIKYDSLQTDCINRFKETSDFKLRIAG
jgi:hypothetical protein